MHNKERKQRTLALSDTPLQLSTILRTKLTPKRQPTAAKCHTKRVKTSNLTLVVPHTHLNGQNDILGIENDLKTSLQLKVDTILMIWSGIKFQLITLQLKLMYFISLALN